MTRAERWRLWLRRAGELQVAPSEFWRLSVREWRWLAGETASALGRTELDCLMALYPDHQETDNANR